MTRQYMKQNISCDSCKRTVWEIPVFKANRELSGSAKIMFQKNPDNIKYLDEKRNLVLREI